MRWTAAAVLLFVSIACAATPGSPGAPGTPAERRTRLLADDVSIDELSAALDDGNMIVRRTAARRLAESGDRAKPALIRAMANDDMLVKRTALLAVAKLAPNEALPHLAKALDDDQVMMRQAAASQLIAVRPRNAQINELLRKASQDKHPEIVRIVSRATWPFHRETTLLAQRKDWDHDVVLVHEIPLPKEGWKFKLDPQRNGHTLNQYKVKFDDAKWDDIEIEQAWQNAGYEYIGVSWYRRTIELPEKPAEYNAVELHFGGVDESTWVWLNGIYIGQHDIGPSGWNEPFNLDITREVMWGKNNQLTVRAMNTAHAGGIWKPVTLQIKK